LERIDPQMDELLGATAHRLKAQGKNGWLAN
jgi:hypothetical protein